MDSTPFQVIGIHSVFHGKHHAWLQFFIGFIVYSGILHHVEADAVSAGVKQKFPKSGIPDYPSQMRLISAMETPASWPLCAATQPLAVIAISVPPVARFPDRTPG